MTETYDLRIERTFAAAPEQVFDALTDAELMARWYAPEVGWETHDVTSDRQVGGAWSVTFGPPGQTSQYREFGRWDELRRPTTIQYTCSMSGTDHDADLVDTTVRIELSEEADGKTLMVLTHTGYKSASARDAHEGGWPMFLDALERVAAAA